MLLRMQFRAQKTARASPPLASVVRSRTRTPAAMRWSLALTTVQRLRKTAAIAAKHTRQIPGMPSDHVIAGSSAHCRYVGALIPVGTTRMASAGSRTSIPRSTLCMGSVAATMYSDAFRRKHRHVRKTYYGADTPSHVPWTGGVIGGTVDLSVQWTTGIEGMNSNKGASLTNWRAWEQPGVYEKRLARAKGKGRGRGRGWRNSIDDVVQVVGAEPG